MAKLTWVTKFMAIKEGEGSAAKKLEAFEAYALEEEEQFNVRIKEDRKKQAKIRKGIRAWHI